jgi:hypothetical protein
MPATTNVETTAAVIRADAAYSIHEVKRRLGLGEWALRQMRRRGLIVRRVGRVSVILGRDLLEHIEQHGKIVE